MGAADVCANWEDWAMENIRVQGMRLGRTPKREDPRSLKLESLLPLPRPSRCKEGLAAHTLGYKAHWFD